VRRQHSGAPFVFVFDMDIEVRRWQQGACLFRPFDQDDGFFFKNVPKTCVQPFRRIAKSIKIKVIEV